MRQLKVHHLLMLLFISYFSIFPAASIPIYGLISNDELISGATVTASNVAYGGTFKSTTTSVHGEYSFENVPIGEVDVTVSKPGYVPITKTVEVKAGILPGPTDFILVPYTINVPGPIRVASPEQKAESFGSFGSSQEHANFLVGEVFYLPYGKSNGLQRFSELKFKRLIYTNVLNIHRKNIRNNFPGVIDRSEYFAIRYGEKFFIPNNVGGTYKPKYEQGNYKFKLVSDGPSRLIIDQDVVVYNPGGSVKKYGTKYLDEGTHRIKVEYFHYAGQDVDLQLFATPPGGTEDLFHPEYGAWDSIGSEEKGETGQGFTFKSTPPLARVTIGGKYIGTTKQTLTRKGFEDKIGPLFDENMSPIEYGYIIELDGYYPDTGTIDSQNTAVDPELEPRLP